MRACASRLGRWVDSPVIALSLRWLALASAAIFLMPVYADDVVVIVNKDNPHTVDRAYVQRIYTGALRGWPDGTAVLTLDRAPDTEAREQFCATVLGKSSANLRAIWSQNIFAGKGLPPRVVSTDVEMKRVVAANRNAIGYIYASQADASVKVLGK